MPNSSNTSSDSDVDVDEGAGENANVSAAGRIFCDGCPRQIGAPYAYSPSVSHPYGKPIVWVRQKKKWNQRLRHIEPRLSLDKQTWLAAPFSEHHTGIVTLIGDGDFKGYYKIEKEGRIMLTLDRPLTISLPGLGLTKNLFHALCIVVEKKKRGSFLGSEARIPDLSSVKETDTQLNAIFGTHDVPRFAIVKDESLDVQTYFKNFGLQNFLTTVDDNTTLNLMDNWYLEDCNRSYADCLVVLQHVFHVRYDPIGKEWTNILQQEWDINVMHASLPVLKMKTGGQKAFFLEQGPDREPHSIEIGFVEAVQLYIKTCVNNAEQGMCPFTYGVHSVHDSAPPSFLKDGDGGARRIAQFINKLLTTKSRKRARKGASAAIKDLDDKMRRFFWLHLPDQLTRHIQAAHTADACEEYCKELMSSHELESKFVSMLQHIHPDDEHWTQGQKIDICSSMMVALDDFYKTRFEFVREV